MTEEFLDINDKCNQFGLSIKSVCHYAKIKFLEIVELSKINEKKFEFEVSLSEELVLVRVNALLSVSGNSFNSAFDEFVSLAGIKM